VFRELTVTEKPNEINTPDGNRYVFTQKTVYWLKIQREAGARIPAISLLFVQSFPVGPELGDSSFKKVQLRLVRLFSL